MTELPQSVRDRLKETAAGDHSGHPDADLLAAFAERSLGAGERQRVLAHLAQCGLCREVLALALPPVTAVAAAPAKAGRSWLTPPLLFRWGAAAAAVVVVSAALWLHRPAAIQPTSDGQFARVGNANTPGAGGTEAAPALSPAMPPVAPPEYPRAMAKRAAPAAPHREAAVAGRAGQDSPVDSRQEENRDELRAAAVPPSAPTPKAVGGGLAGRPASSTAANTANAGAAKYAPAQAARSETMARERTADSAAMASVAPREAVRAEAQAPVAKALKGTPAPWFWSISREGKLQRSTDQVNWQTAEVAGGVTFHSLARIGRQLWAGGSGGALYHSADNGDSWQRVALPGLTDADTITDIDFPTPLNGSVTGPGGRWSTSDGGRTWAKE